MNPPRVHEPGGRPIGSSSNFRAACTVRSRAVGIPSRRSLRRRAWESSVPAPEEERIRRDLRSSRSAGRNAACPEEDRAGCQAHRHLPTLPPGCPEPAPTQPRGRPGHRRGCRGHRTDAQDHRSPTDATWSASPVPAPRQSLSGHGTSIFTGDLRPSSPVVARLLPPFAMYTAFPCLGLLRRLRPVREPSADDGPARRRPGWAAAGAAADGSHVHHDRSTGSVPSSSPAASPRVRRRPSSWPPCRRLHPAQESPTTSVGVHRYPAHIHQVGAGATLEGVQPLVHSRSTFLSR